MLAAGMLGWAGTPAEADGTGAAGLRPIAITIDDLPIQAARLHPEPADRDRMTVRILGVLTKHHVPAVGLVVWDRVKTEADRKLLERWLDAGEELGNHSNTHPDYTTTNSAAYIADVEAARAGLAGFLASHGKQLRYFRFPFLDEGNTAEKLSAMRDYLAKTGQRNLPVTIDNQDWSFEDPWLAASKASGSARAKSAVAAVAAVADEYQAALRLAVIHHEAVGDALFKRTTPQILLLHANEVGAENWDDLFTWLERTGHRFATVEEVMKDPAFADPPEFLATNGPGLWDRIRDARRKKDARMQVEELLKKQIAAWNAGDIETFTSCYADDAVFLSPSGIERGRAAVLERYKRKYPDAKAMGTLSIEIVETRNASGVEFSMAGDAVPSRVHAVSLVGRWKLTYPDRDPVSGVTLLVFHRRGDSWEIVQDASM